MDKPKNKIEAICSNNQHLLDIPEIKEILKAWEKDNQFKLDWKSTIDNTPEPDRNMLVSWNKSFNGDFNSFPQTAQYDKDEDRYYPDNGSDDYFKIKPSFFAYIIQPFDFEEEIN